MNLSKKKLISYFWPMAFVKITGFVTFSQLMIDMTGLPRREGFEQTTGVCAALFILAVVCAIVVYILNMKRKRNAVD